jgi:hypothetical protein
VFLLPGVNHSAQGALLYWTGELFAEAGWKVVAFEWDHNAIATMDSSTYLQQEIAVAIVEHGVPNVIVGKSFGTKFLPHAVDSDVLGVWLTPVLNDPNVLRALRGASPSHLAIGGAADPTWQPALGLATRAKLMSIPDADHFLSVPGSGWQANYALHQKVFLRIQEHIMSNLHAPSM